MLLIVLLLLLSFLSIALMALMFALGSFIAKNQGRGRQPCQDPLLNKGTTHGRRLA